MMGWISRFLRSRVQKRIDARNDERKKLCSEYASNLDPMRRGQIIARLMELNGEADIKGAAERIGFELEGICRRTAQNSTGQRQIDMTRQAPSPINQQQVDLMRQALNPAFEHDHFPNDLKHFRKEYCE